MRDEEGWADVLLLALTRYGQEEDRHRSREAGFNSHYVKPMALALNFGNCSRPQSN